MDPISTTIMLTGEDAVIRAPAKVKPFNPNDSEDYKPNPPVDHPVRGITEQKIVLISGAEGAFTIEATSWPEGLAESAAVLVWRGRNCRVLQLRERYWLGALNGITIFWGA